MIGVNETRFLAKYKLCECKCTLHERYVLQTNNGMMLNVDVSVND